MKSGANLLKLFHSKESIIKYGKHEQLVLKGIPRRGGTVRTQNIFILLPRCFLAGKNQSTCLFILLCATITKWFYARYIIRRKNGGDPNHPIDCLFFLPEG